MVKGTVPCGGDGEMLSAPLLLPMGSWWVSCTAGLGGFPLPTTLLSLRIPYCDWIKARCRERAEDEDALGTPLVPLWKTGAGCPIDPAVGNGRSKHMFRAGRASWACFKQALIFPRSE